MAFWDSWIGEEERSLTQEDIEAVTRTLQSALSDGISSINEDERNAAKTLEEYRKSPPLRIPVDLISRSLAGVNWRTNDEQFAKLMEEPVIGFSNYDFFNLCTRHLLLTGQCVIYLFRKDKRWNLAPVPPTEVEDTGDNYRIFFGDDTSFPGREVPEKRLVFIRAHSVENPYSKGFGLGQTLQDEIDVASMAARAVASALNNDSIPASIVSMAGAREQQAERLEEKMKATHKGPSNAGKLAVLSADVEVDNLEKSFDEMELLDQRKYSSQVARNLYSIPPEMVGILDGANRATINAAEYLHLKNNVLPRIIKFKDSFNSQIIPKLNDLAADNFSDTFIDYEDFVPENKQFKKEMMSQFPNVYSKNEARKLSGHEAREGWDQEPIAADPSGTTDGTDMPPQPQEDETEMFVIRTDKKNPGYKKEETDVRIKR